MAAETPRHLMIDSELRQRFADTNTRSRPAEEVVSGYTATRLCDDVFWLVGEVRRLSRLATPPAVPAPGAGDGPRWIVRGSLSCSACQGTGMVRRGARLLVCEHCGTLDAPPALAHRSTPVEGADHG